MKHKFLTAILLWVMLAGYCRGQGQPHLSVSIVPQLAIKKHYPLLGGGVGVGLNYNLPLNNKLTLTLGSYLVYLHSYTYCDSIGQLPTSSLPREGGTCINPQRSSLWYVQIPLMGYYNFIPQKTYSLVVGGGLQANWLLLNANKEKVFMPKKITLSAPLSLGINMRLPKQQLLQIELMYSKSIQTRYRRLFEVDNLLSLKTTFKW